MKPSTYLTAALAVLPGTLGLDVKKSVIIWFDQEFVPSDIIDQAKKTITDANGQITHVYKLINGFSAIATEKALEQVQTYGSTYSIRVEEDQMVSVA